MAAHNISPSDRVGEDFEFLPAGTYNLDARPGKPQWCARLVIAMAAGHWTELRNDREVDSPPGAVPMSFQHMAHTYRITCSAAIAVYW
jgi:hypothetical protein